MAKTGTYTQIATYNFPSAATNYTFSSIPSTYTDLVIVCNIKSPLDDFFTIRLNSDSGTNYSATRVYGDGTGVTSNRASSSTEIAFADISTGKIGTHILNIFDYANTSINKSLLIRMAKPDGSGTFGSGIVNAQWRSTAAVSSITFATIYNANNYGAGSTITLYGIEAYK